MTEVEENFTHTFLCGTSSKLLHLTGEELKRIPYLASLVEHDDDSSSIRNEKGEYVLNPPIPHSWLTTIQRSITSEQPSLLFSQLPPTKDVLGVLRLYDQLGINPIPDPLLKDTHLVLSGETEADRSSRYAAYHQANQMEARNTSAEFLVALTKKKYNLDDSRTRDNIFSLIEVILSSPTVFGRWFCLRTLTIVDKFCGCFFLPHQRSQLSTARKSLRYQKESLDPSTIVHGRNSLPVGFRNAFSWRGIPTSTEVNETVEEFPPNTEFAFSRWLDSWLSSLMERPELPELGGVLHTTRSTRFNNHHYGLILRVPSKMAKSTLIGSFLPDNNRRSGPHYIREHTIVDLTAADKVLDPSSNQLELNKEQAQSARSGRFNTLPRRRPSVDRFKHRSGPKAKKHR